MQSFSQILARNHVSIQLNVSLTHSATHPRTHAHTHKIQIKLTNYYFCHGESETKQESEETSTDKGWQGAIQL